MANVDDISDNVQKLFQCPTNATNLGYWIMTETYKRIGEIINPRMFV